jgi:hypothetical protein
LDQFQSVSNGSLNFYEANISVRDITNTGKQEKKSFLDKILLENNVLVVGIKNALKTAIND